MTPELQTITRTLRELPPDESAVLLTLVATEGSTYRRPGARMLYLRSGELLGTISGGCLREELAAHARELLQQNLPHRLISYCSWEVADEVLGLGLGCEGTYTVFLQRCTAAHPLAQYAPAILQGEPATLALVTASDNPSFPVGSTALHFPRQHTIHGHISLWTDIVRQHPMKNPSRTSYQTLESPSLSLYLEHLEPPLTFHIFGAGEDTRPLVRLAAYMGWLPMVYDFRPALLTRTRFPHATRLQLLSLDEPLPPLQDGAGSTAAVVMSHHLRFDRQVLQALLATDIPYIGLLGPRKRTLRMLEALPPSLRARAESVLFNPVGLDIGAETPEEIALCILAEIRAFHAGREGGFLRNRTESIHATSLP